MKYFIKKSHVSMHLTIEDYFTAKEEPKILSKIKFSTNSNIINRDVKLSRSTVEEIDEKAYNKKITKQYNHKSKQKTVSFSDIEED